jgi:hypothetical protein
MMAHAGLLVIASYTPCSMDGMDPEESSTDLESALRFNLGVFLPFARFGDGDIKKFTDDEGTKFRLVEGQKLRDELGFFFEAGLIEVDSESKARSRYYGGLRWANHPEWYIDALLGKTEGLDSDRLEVRGQFPIAPATDNSRVYLGIIANLGINEPKDSTDEDLIRVYVKWNVDLKAFFQNFSNGDD